MPYFPSERLIKADEFFERFWKAAEDASLRAYEISQTNFCIAGKIIAITPFGFVFCGYDGPIQPLDVYVRSGHPALAGLHSGDWVVIEGGPRYEKKNLSFSLSQLYVISRSAQARAENHPFLEKEGFARHDGDYLYLRNLVRDGYPKVYSWNGAEANVIQAWADLQTITKLGCRALGISEKTPSVMMLQALEQHFRGTRDESAWRSVLKSDFKDGTSFGLEHSKPHEIAEFILYLAVRCFDSPVVITDNPMAPATSIYEKKDFWDGLAVSESFRIYQRGTLLVEGGVDRMNSKGMTDARHKLLLSEGVPLSASMRILS